MSDSVVTNFVKQFDTLILSVLSNSVMALPYFASYTRFLYLAFVSRQPGEKNRDVKAKLPCSVRSKPSRAAVCLACFDAFRQTWIYVRSLLQGHGSVLGSISKDFHVDLRCRLHVCSKRFPLRLFETFMSLRRPRITTPRKGEVQSERAQDSNLHGVGRRGNAAQSRFFCEFLSKTCIAHDSFLYCFTKLFSTAPFFTAARIRLLLGSAAAQEVGGRAEASRAASQGKHLSSDR